MKFKILFIASLSYSLLLISCNNQIDTHPNEPNTNVHFDSVKIGNQIWMKRNLNVDHYRNGDPIPQISDSSQWVNLTSGAWCYYNNDPALGAIYGKLYNWYAVNDPRGLAPQGWHLTSRSEWRMLIEYIPFKDWYKLKETSTDHWVYPNNGTDEIGFSALPGGIRFENFINIGKEASWWTTDFDYQISNPYAIVMMFEDSLNHWVINYQIFGRSIRCVKD